MSVATLLNRLFSSKPDVKIYSNLLKPIKLKNSVSFNFEFDGTVSWLNQVDYIKDPNFLFKTHKEYEFFKRNNHRFFKSEIVEIGEDSSAEEVVSKIKEIKDLITKNERQVDFYKKENFYDLDSMDKKTINLVILSPVDFYKKLGMELMNSLFIQMMRTSHLRGVQFSFIGPYSDLPKSIQFQINNHITSDRDRYYLNNHPYLISLTKLDELFDYLKSYQSDVLDFSRFTIASGQSRAYYFEGNVLNYSFSENQNNFCFGLSMTEGGDLIVMDIIDYRIGMIEKSKLSNLKKSKIYLK